MDTNTHKQLASGSDNLAITWAVDGNQYTTWGDGGGFAQIGRSSLGVSRVEGDANNYVGTEVWRSTIEPALPTTTPTDGKSYGIISVDGVLYMWVSPGSDTTGYTEARLYQYDEINTTWIASNWAFTQSDGLIFPTFLQNGMDYANGPPSAESKENLSTYHGQVLTL